MLYYNIHIADVCEFPNSVHWKEPTASPAAVSAARAWIATSTHPPAAARLCGHVVDCRSGAWSVRRYPGTLSHQEAVKDDWGYVRKNSGFQPKYMPLVRRDSGSINKGDNFHGLKKISYAVEICDFVMIPLTQHKQNFLVPFGRCLGIERLTILKTWKITNQLLFFFPFPLKICISKNC